MVKCPICNHEGISFLPVNDGQRKNALCPECGSLERQRLYYLYLKNVIDEKAFILHIAPEKCLKNWLLYNSLLSYMSIDKVKGRAMNQGDITKMDFKSNMFDTIICIHVFEHIIKDMTAMKEVHRVLMPGGFALLQVPITQTQRKSVRKKRGADGNDHVWVYGTDYKDKLMKAGFKVQIIPFEDIADISMITRYGLIKEDLYICKK